MLYFQVISEIDIDSDNQVTGVVTEDGRHVSCKMILSNATAHTTYLKLVDKVRFSYTWYTQLLLYVYMMSIVYKLFFLYMLIVH